MIPVAHAPRTPRPRRGRDGRHCGPSFVTPPKASVAGGQDYPELEPEVEDLERVELDPELEPVELDDEAPGVLG